MIIFLLVFFGLVAGSFISAVSYRIPRGLGFVKGRSFCDNCKKSLKWFDNIPLFSYLFYCGVSRCCNKKISIRYPLIEAISSVGVVVIYLFFHNFVFILLFLLLLTIFVIDLENQIIPDELSWIILFLGLIFNFSFVNIFAGFLLSLSLLTLYLVTNGCGMGLGDVKLTIGLGVWLGLSRGFTFLFLSFLIGGIVASLLLILKKANMKTKIAFGPFLIIGFLITLLIL